MSSPTRKNLEKHLSHPASARFEPYDLGNDEEVWSSVEVLFSAQADCLDREIPLAEIAEAIRVLSRQSKRLEDLAEKFSRGLREPDEGIRFEITSQCLLVIERELRVGVSQ